MKDHRTWFPWEPPSGSLGSTSPSLVAGYRSGDTESWQRLVDIYGPVVYHVFLARIAPQDRDDVFQEVFATAWKSRERFTKTPGRPSFRAWLHRITENTVLNHQRGNRRRQRAAAVGGEEHGEMIEQLTTHDQPTVNADEPEATSAAEPNSWNGSFDPSRDIVLEGATPDGERARILVRRQVLMMVLKELAGQRRTRDLALRQIIHGESAEAVAQALGTNAGAAYTAKSRVLKRAREVLHELGEPADRVAEPDGERSGAEP